MKQHLTAALISCLIFFSLSEFAARVWMRHFGNALEVSRPLLEADPTLGWKQRAHMNTTFLNTSVKTNEAGWRTRSLASLPENMHTVLVLGPSSSFGWGVEANETYSAQLENLLQETTSVIVLNAGEIGYSTEQGVRLYSQPDVASLKANVVVIAYGVNDLDRSRFYFQSTTTDAEEFALSESKEKVQKQNAMHASALIDALTDIADAIRVRYAPPPVESTSNNPVPSVRVPLSDFTANIEALVHAARARGAAPVLMTTSTNLPRAERSPEARELYVRGVRAWQTADIESTQQSLVSAIALEPDLCEAYYYLAAIAMRSGNASVARIDFEKARSTESYRINEDVDAYNATLKKIATDEHVPLLVLDTLFEGHDRNTLFVDPIHFSQKGSALVAAGLANIIRSNGLLK